MNPEIGTLTRHDFDCKAGTNMFDFECPECGSNTLSPTSIDNEQPYQQVLTNSHSADDPSDDPDGANPSKDGWLLYNFTLEAYTADTRKSVGINSSLPNDNVALILGPATPTYFTLRTDISCQIVPIQMERSTWWT